MHVIVRILKYRCILGALMPQKYLHEYNSKFTAWVLCQPFPKGNVIPQHERAVVRVQTRLDVRVPVAYSMYPQRERFGCIAPPVLQIVSPLVPVIRPCRSVGVEHHPDQVGEEAIVRHVVEAFELGRYEQVPVYELRPLAHVIPMHGGRRRSRRYRGGAGGGGGGAPPPPLALPLRSFLSSANM